MNRDDVHLQTTNRILNIDRNIYRMGTLSEQYEGDNRHTISNWVRHVLDALVG